MESQGRQHDLPWDHEGHCRDEDVNREDLPLYHEAAVEAWVLEHETGIVSRTALKDPGRSPGPPFVRTD